MKEAAVAKAPAQKMQGYAAVKAVLSGDSVTLVGAALAADQAAPIKEVTLSGINAPKFARGKATKDEAWAFESREFLRKKIYGKQVSFTTNYTHENSGREYADIFFEGENVAHALLRNGLAKVKLPSKKETKIHPERQILLDIEKQAREVGSGLWSKSTTDAEHIRDIQWTPGRAFFDQVRGKQIPGQVDRVRDGSTVRVEVFHPGFPKHTMVLLHLAGVMCPRTPMPEKDDQSNQKPLTSPPFADEAQKFTEKRLLGQDVQVIVQAIDKSDNFYGTIIHPRGNITLRLLETGLGKKVQWTAALTPDEAKFTEAENKAKAQRLRLWQDGAADSVERAPIDRDFQAKVVQIVSGDTLIVKQTDDSPDLRLTLASVRAERSDLAAKEFVRSRLIGKKVRVLYEYTNNNARTGEPVIAVTILQGALNITEGLVHAGYAEVVKHRVDGPRSRFFDKLMDAEALARKGKKGRWADKKQQQQPEVVDLTERSRAAPASKDSENKDEDDKKEAAKKSERTARAKGYLASLQREKSVTAVIEHVFNGGRVKAFIPKENIIISFVLAGIRCPNPRDTKGTVDPIGKEALEYTRSRVLQHNNVKLEIETTDRADNFIGTLWYGNRQNLAVELLRAGFGQIVGFSAQRSPHADELYAAEKIAKDAKLKFWENYVEKPPEEPTSVDSEENAETTHSTSNRNEFKVNITEITDAASFYVHVVGDTDLKKVEEQMAVFSESIPDAPDDWEPSKGEICAGLFTVDGNESWYRIRIESYANVNGDYRVFFIDYGNHDELAKESLRPLPEGLSKIRPCSKPCALAGIKAPSASSDHFDSAIHAFSDLAWGRELHAKLELLDRNNKMHLSLWDNKETNPVSINRELLRAGWVRVLERPEGRLRSLCNELREDELSAKQARYNIWEYGDVSDDEEEVVDDRSKGGRRRREAGP